MVDQLVWSRVLRAVTDPASTSAGVPVLGAVVGLGMDVSADSVGCSITVARGDGFVTPAASGPVAVELDAAQYRAGSGPCVAAVRDGRVHDVDIATRPGEFAVFAAAAAAHGVGSSLSWPVPTEPRRAALNLYASAPAAFAPRRPRAVAALLARAVAQVLALPTSPVDTRAGSANNAGSATSPVGTGPEAPGRDRGTILDAVAALVTARGVSPDGAFELLARRSAVEHRALVEVARDVLTGSTLPAWVSARRPGSAGGDLR